MDGNGMESGHGDTPREKESFVRGRPSPRLKPSSNKPGEELMNSDEKALAKAAYTYAKIALLVLARRNDVDWAGLREDILVAMNSLERVGKINAEPGEEVSPARKLVEADMLEMQRCVEGM